MADLIQYEYQDNLISFEIDEEIMVNATQMAKPFGKLVKDFLKNKEIKDYIDSLNKSRQSVRWENSPNGQIVIVIQGGNPEKQGTWMHRQLAIRFAMWLNSDFAVWVTDKIDILMQKGSVFIAPNSISKNDLLDLKNYITYQNQALKEELKTYIDEKQDKFALGLAKDLEALSEYLLSSKDWQEGLDNIQELLKAQALDTELLKETVSLILNRTKKVYHSKDAHFVYLCKQEGRKRHKIGYSKDLLTRQEILNLWGDVFEIHKIMVGSKYEAKLIERLLHRIYQDKQITKEIFALEYEDEKFICSL